MVGGVVSQSFYSLILFAQLLNYVAATCPTCQAEEVDAEDQSLLSIQRRSGRTVESNWVRAWWETQGTGPPPWGADNPDGSDPSCVANQIPVGSCGVTGPPVDAAGDAVNLEDVQEHCSGPHKPAWAKGKWPVLLHGSYGEQSGCDTSNIRSDWTRQQVDDQMKQWQCLIKAIYGGPWSIDKPAIELPQVKAPDGTAVKAALSFGHGAFEGMCGNSALLCNPAGDQGLNQGTNCIVNLQNGPRTWSGEFAANAYINGQNYGGICVQPYGYFPPGSNGNFEQAVPDFFVEVDGKSVLNKKYLLKEYQDSPAVKECYN
eukprot:TRINITY_DN25514_c0_g2_i1.p1 TRINITY_DN25514_c0_g2~~TRINITY_DN25514_c0_g2_i1.p1  ORF type:complete len:334 (+),score=42.88 TRINITY_DN25514_c0_g2_i1:57-1004(+)